VLAHRLLLDGLPGAAHRSGSPPVAGGSQPLRISETQGTNKGAKVKFYSFINLSED